LNDEIFREYDIRGHADDDLDNETVSLIGKAFGSIAREKSCSDFAIARDNRKSSGRISKTLIKALLGTGVNVTDLGILPIPALYFSIIHLKKHGGIMVTGSHLPKEFNGMKMSYSGDAATLYGEQIRELRSRAESGQFLSGKGALEKAGILPEYIEAVAPRVKLSRPLKVAVDCGNATASLAAQKILEKIGCEVLPLYCVLDARFPNHHPDPTKPENLSALAKTVRGKKCDVGIAFDGDADRIGAVDERGNLLWGDVLLALFSKAVLEKNPGAKIVFEVKCSQALVDTIRGAGGVPLMWKTGHSLIKKKMKEENALLAGEMSGHMFFRDNYYGFDDALFAAARLCELLSQSEKPLSARVAELPRYYSTPEIRISVPEQEKWELVERVKEHFSLQHEVIGVDGARIVFSCGWALVRASNTSAKIVLRMEARSEKGLEGIKKEMRSALKQFFPETGLSF